MIVRTVPVAVTAAALIVAAATVALAAGSEPDPNATSSTHVVVFGAAGGGVSAAIAAARTGANVTLIGAKNGGGLGGSHIGGMITGGLQHTDCGNASAIGGIAWEYFVAVERQYPNRSTNPYLKPETGPPCWLFEAHVVRVWRGRRPF